MTISTIGDIIRTHGQVRPNAVAVKARERTTTYGELDARSSQVAQALRSDGVGSQDRVAFLDKGNIEFFEVLFGGAKLNAVNLGVNWRLAPPEVAYIVNDAEAVVLIVGSDFVPVLEAIESSLTTVKRIVVIGGHERHISYDEWISSHVSDDPGVVSQAGDVAYQLYTSGTTGLPKGVMLTQSNVFAAVKTVAAEWDYNPDRVNLVAMPLFHVGGIGFALIGLFAGCRSVLMREVDPAEMLDLITEERISHTFVVPAVLQFMLLTPGVRDRDFSALHTIIYGASPISVDVLTRSVETFGCQFVQAYGLTETHGTIARLNPDDHDPRGAHTHRLRSAGRPITGAEIRIVDAESGEDLPTGAVGEIWCRSPQNMLGYWGHPVETAKTITHDGWLKTGDAGYFDEDGYLFIYDRIKDMIISGGENVYPAEIENVLMSHPGIEDVAVIGVPSERWGETVKAVVVRAEGHQPAPEELIAYTRDRLAHYKCPTSVDFIDVLPRNASGKIQKRELRASYL